MISTNNKTPNSLIFLGPGTQRQVVYMDNSINSNYLQVKYKRLKVAQALAVKFTDHRIVECCKNMKGVGVQVKINQDGGAYYSGLMHCKSVWDCPHCSAVIAAARRDEIKQALDNWTAQGGKVKLVTYTVRHNKSDKLDTLQNAVNQAYRFSKSGRGYQYLKEQLNIVGSIVANEINYSQEYGWHYHRHEIVFYKSDNDFHVYQDNVYLKYYQELVNQGFSALPGIGVNVSDGEGNLSNYLSKWGLENELTSNKETFSKTPFQLLDDEQDHELYIEYSRVMQGKRRLTWSRGLKLLLLIEDKSDEEILEQTNEDLILKFITYDEWKVIILRDLFQEVLLQAQNRPNFDNWYYYHVSIYV